MEQEKRSTEKDISTHNHHIVIQCLVREIELTNSFAQIIAFASLLFAGLLILITGTLAHNSEFFSIYDFNLGWLMFGITLLVFAWTVRELTSIRNTRKEKIRELQSTFFSPHFCHALFHIWESDSHSDEVLMRKIDKFASSLPWS